MEHSLSLVRFLMILALVAGCAAGGSDVREPQPEARAAAESPAAEGPTGALEELGIEIHSVMMTAQGMFIDFRYRVVDPEKAKLILHRTTTDSVALFHQKSGQGVEVFQGVGKLGKLKQTTYAPEAGRIYSMIFRNYGLFHPGDLVALKVGEHRVENIAIQ